VPRLPRYLQWSLEACFHLMNRGHKRGIVQLRGCLGNTLRTRPGDHTSPKRKRGFRIHSLALRASMPGVLPAIEPGHNREPVFSVTKQETKTDVKRHHFLYRRP